MDRDSGRENDLLPELFDIPLNPVHRIAAAGIGSTKGCDTLASDVLNRSQPDEQRSFNACQTDDLAHLLILNLVQIVVDLCAFLVVCLELSVQSLLLLLQASPLVSSGIL